MSWLKNLIKKKQSAVIQNNSDFWQWFQEKESHFFEAIKSNKNVDKNFINEFSSGIEQLNEQFFFLAGMMDENIAELIITADGNFKIIPYVEDLIKMAPQLPNWKFTANKPSGESTITIEMSGFKFNDENIQFVVNENKEYPDEINLTFVYNDFDETKTDLITSGVLIYLDNYLGEIKSVTSIDELKVVSPEQEKGELVSIEKLESYLVWREKEFIEKYDKVNYDSKNDSYASVETTTNNGLPIIAIMNATLLKWDSKASHPWMVCLDINYDGSSKNGLPDDKVYKIMDDLEDEMLSLLKTEEGYLNIGRETGNNLRTIFLACTDFRQPVKALDQLKLTFSDFEVDYEVFKDKYWKSLKRYSDSLYI